MNQIKMKLENMASKHPMKTALLAGLYAMVLNATLFIVFDEAEIINSNDLIKTSRHITIEQLIMVSLTANLIGSIGFYIFDKFIPNGLVLFKNIAIIILIGSCIIPFIFFEGISEALAINLMHVVLVGILLYGVENNFENK